MNFKERFPDDESLSKYILTNWGTTTEEIRAVAGYLEKRNRKFQIVSAIASVYFVGLSLILVSFNLNFMDVNSLLPRSFSEDVNFFVVFWIIVSFLLIGFVFPGMLIAYSIITTRIIAATINKKLFPKIFNYMDLDAKHIAVDKKFIGVELPSFWKLAWTEKSEQLRADSFQYEQVASQLKHSELITIPRNGMSVDDIISIKIGGSTLLVAELNVININRNSIRSIKKIFHGYFISFDIPLTLQHKTFVSTNGDTYGFGHMVFWHQLMNNGIQETKLEWNEFEKLLHVATTSASEARYILTPNFMSDLYDWWKLQKGNIRIAFMEEKMYILYPDSDIKLQSSVSAITTESLQNYIISNAIPLLHILHLIEDLPTKPEVN